jgi:hypothetical protein
MAPEGKQSTEQGRGRVARRVSLRVDGNAFWQRLAERAVDVLTPRTAGVAMLADRERSTLMVLDAWLRV